MRDVRHQLHSLHGRLAAVSSGPAGGVVMFVGAGEGDGVSSTAASFAMLAADMADKPVWLLDLDLLRNRTFTELARGAFLKPGDEVGPPFAAGLRTAPFFVVDPPISEPESQAGLFTVHRVGSTRVMATRFNTDLLAPGQQVRIRSHPDYWRAVRLVTQWTIVDAPALSVSTAALAIAPHADAVVLVVRADTTPVEAVRDLRDAVVAHGGRIAGMVMTDLKPDAVRLARRQMA